LGAAFVAFPPLAGAFDGFAADFAIFVTIIICPTLLAFRLRLVLKFDQTTLFILIQSK
jgi:hypothetical protein